MFDNGIQAGTGLTFRRVNVIALAAAATALVWLIGRLNGINYVVGTAFGAREITLVLTVAATVAAGMAGWLVVAALQRYAAHPLRIWIVVGIVVLAASIVPVFLTPAALATQFVLSVQHCVAAAILIPALPQTRPSAGKGTSR